MSLSPEEIKAIIDYRIEKSAQAFKEAKDNATLGNWNLVVNRLYYAVFYMVLAILLKNNYLRKVIMERTKCSIKNLLLQINFRKKKEESTGNFSQ